MSSILLVVVLSAGVEPELLDRLAERARVGEAMARNGSVVLTVDADELDGAGKVVKRKHSRLKLTRRDGQPPRRELYEATEDGKDVLAEEQRRLDARKPDGDRQGFRSPFHPDTRSKYRFTRGEEADGGVTVRFEPAAGADPELMVGEATVEPATGDVLALRMKPSKNPPMVESLEMVAEFDARGPAGRAMSRLEMRGAGGFLFTRKRFRVVTRFSDYQALDAAVTPGPAGSSTAASPAPGR